MKKVEEKHWVFHAHVEDRAGAVTSIASAFSNEGLSIDTIVGHGQEQRVATDGSVVLTFRCTEDEKNLMVRKVTRLSKIRELAEHPYESRGLRKSLIMLVSRELKPADVAGETVFLTCEAVQHDDEGWTYFLAGPPSEIDPCLERLAAEGIVEDVVYSIVGL